MSSARRTKLSPDAEAIRARLNAAYDFDDAQVLILNSALECFDRMQAARAVIEAEGMTFPDSRGNPRVRPEVLIERDARSLLLKHWKQLGLDLEPLTR